MLVETTVNSGKIIIMKLSDMVYKEDRIREGLTKLQHYIAPVVLQTGMSLTSGHLRLRNSHFPRVLDALNVLQSFDIVINIIMEGQKGVLHPLVVPPTLLMDAFMRNSFLFPRDTALPFPLTRFCSFVV